MALLALSACSAPVAAGGRRSPVRRSIRSPSSPARTHGDGTLDQIFKDERTLTVDSIGRPERDGSLILIQRIGLEGDPPRTRVWKLRQVAPGRYAGTLTDANGPVETLAVGRAIRIRYPMKGGLMVEQWLTALPGGRALDNRMTVTSGGSRWRR